MGGNDEGRGETGEGEWGGTSGEMMKRLTERVRGRRKERDGQINQGEERRRQTDNCGRHLQPHRQYKEVLHLDV